MTAADPGEPSHTTNGETFSGAMASNWSSATSAIMSVKTPSVMRVRAAGQMALAVMP
ncbi:hypothetical protein D3C83_186130 [compost metagenome]